MEVVCSGNGHAGTQGMTEDGRDCDKDGNDDVLASPVLHRVEKDAHSL